MSRSPAVRPAVRALVLDQHDEVLLVRLSFPHGAWWVLPGGGIQTGESDHDALRRELAEEVGLVDVAIGEHLWTRTHMFTFVDGDGVAWSGQSENVFLVRADRFEPSPHMSPTELSNENIDRFQWWSHRDICAHAGPDHFAPRDLCAHLGDLLAHGPAPTPIEIIQHG